MPKDWYPYGGNCWKNTVMNQISCTRNFLKCVATVNDGIFRAYFKHPSCTYAHTVTGLQMHTHVDVSSGFMLDPCPLVLTTWCKEKVSDWMLSKKSWHNPSSWKKLTFNIQALQDVVRLGDLYGVDVRRWPSILKLSNGQTSPSWRYVVWSAVPLHLLDVCQSFLISMQNVTLLVVLTLNQKSEFVDDFVMKLRTVKFARTKAYDQLYSGDPTFITTSMSWYGCWRTSPVLLDGLRFLNTLDNISIQNQTWQFFGLTNCLTHSVVTVAMTTNTLLSNTKVLKASLWLRRIWWNGLYLILCITTWPKRRTTSLRNTSVLVLTA